jgi:hypothetical protein
MPHLVAPLISGIVGAANGTAEFFAAGTAVLSTSVYADAGRERLCRPVPERAL